MSLPLLPLNLVIFDNKQRLTCILQRLDFCCINALCSSALNEKKNEKHDKKLHFSSFVLDKRKLPYKTEEARLQLQRLQIHPNSSSSSPERPVRTQQREQAATTDCK